MEVILGCPICHNKMHAFITDHSRPPYGVGSANCTFCKIRYSFANSEAVELLELITSPKKNGAGSLPLTPQRLKNPRLVGA